MLNAEPARLTKLGKVTIEAGGIVVDDFDCQNCTCRDAAVLAVLWAIGELQRELMATLERPGRGQIFIGSVTARTTA